MNLENLNALEFMAYHFFYSHCLFSVLFLQVEFMYMYIFLGVILFYCKEESAFFYIYVFKRKRERGKNGRFYQVLVIFAGECYFASSHQEATQL